MRPTFSWHNLVNCEIIMNTYLGGNIVTCGVSSMCVFVCVRGGGELKLFQMPTPLVSHNNCFTL